MGYDVGESVLARRTAWMLERYAYDVSRSTVRDRRDLLMRECGPARRELCRHR